MLTIEMHIHKDYGVSRFNSGKEKVQYVRYYSYNCPFCFPGLSVGMQV